MRVDGGGVQGLPDVPDIGEPPLPAEQPPGQAGAGGDRLQQRGDALAVQHRRRRASRQLVEQGVSVGPVPVGPVPVGPAPVCSAQLGDRPPEEAGQRRVADPDRPRLLQRVKQRQPLPRGGVPKTLAVPESTAGTPTAASASRILCLVVRADEDGDVAGPQQVARAVVAPEESSADVRGHVAGDQGAAFG